MKYAEITKSSFVDGEGCRTVLWLSGCCHHCKGCHNPELQNPDYGRDTTTETIGELIRYLQNPYIDGLTISGGDPMYPANRREVQLIANYIKRHTEKTIWMYTGYLLEEIEKDPVLEPIDVIVDGPYIEGRPAALYRGSDNQRIWRKENGVWKM